MTKVAILVPSFRPDLFFRKLLPELYRQITVMKLSSHYTFETFVLIPEQVDIDSHVSRISNLPLNVLRTRDSGFSIPRNLLWNSAKDFDITIFIDDDQLPCSNWLKELLNGIETNPNYSVYFGDIFFSIPNNSPNKSFARLLPADRIGSETEVFSISHGIANSAYLRNLVPPLVDPFRLDFNDGGEDVSFFASLKQMGCTFFELSGCAVTEEWELSRLQAKALSARNKRGLNAYYKLRQESNLRNWSDYFNSIRVYSRLFVTILLTPVLLLILALNILNPFEVARIQIRYFISRIFLVSTIPWKVKIKRLIEK